MPRYDAGIGGRVCERGAEGGWGGAENVAWSDGGILSTPAAVCLTSPALPPSPSRVLVYVRVWVGALRAACCLLSFVVLRAGVRLKCIGCRVPAPCDEEHRKPAARGLLSLISLLRALLLNVTELKHLRRRCAFLPTTAHETNPFFFAVLANVCEGKPPCVASSR